MTIFAEPIFEKNKKNLLLRAAKTRCKPKSASASCKCCKLQVLQIETFAKLRKIRGQASKQANKQSDIVTS